MPAKNQRVRFKPSYYVKIYELSREGMSLTQIAGALGVDKRTLRAWRDKDPAVKEALRKGKSIRDSNRGETFSDYVYKRLPEHLKELWDEMRAADREKNPEKSIELMISKHGKRTKQLLFVHALVSSNFNAAEACRKIGLPYVTFTKWKEYDAKFHELLGFIHEMKKDFVEGCLMNLIADGDAGATIFASKTLNRDRGYDPRVTIEHTGSVKHAHLSLDKILERLPPKAQRMILQQIRNGETPQLEAHKEGENIEDAEVIEKEPA